jgi:fermentation-respiration switch protein FrsA (DUF1100 family)
MTVERRDLTFPTGDSYAAAWLFLPDRGSSGAPAPAVAMAHGLGAVKEMYLESFARRFAEAGIAAWPRRRSHRLAGRSHHEFP